MKSALLFMIVLVTVVVASDAPPPEISGFVYVSDVKKFVGEDSKQLSADGRRAIGVVRAVLAFRLKITEFAHKADYRDAHGSWKLAHDTGMPGEKKKKNEVSIRIKDRGISLYLTEERGRLLLWDFWGDPDEWEFIKYEKRG